ncbi:MAG: hypothetical protein LBC75_00140 [Fibromonadaceae bacterium]|jgi:hypothetical protein|nr:hypothetical protein [Fibromonadaceae bacterium]
MKMPIKLFACAILAFFAISGCDFSSNTDDESLGARDELSSKQGEDNGGTSVPPPSGGGGDPMPPPEQNYVPPSKPEEPKPCEAPWSSVIPCIETEEGWVVAGGGEPEYVKEPEKEPPQQQPIDSPKPVTWSDEVEKWIRAQYQIDPKEQEQREVLILNGIGGSVKAKLVLTVDGIRRLEGGLHVIFPDEYVE